MIAIGSDHGGFDLKVEIIKHLEEKGYEVKDFGTYDPKDVDYPEFGLAVAEAVKDGICEKGILICGTGLGVSITANKVPGIRAALCSDCYTARMSREHNDANILALGGRVVGKGLALAIVDTWLETEFIGGKHKRRIDKIRDVEKKYARGVED